MVATFLRLKVALVAAGLRSINAGGVAGFVAAALLALLIGGTGALAGASLRFGDPDAAAPALLGGFGFVFVMWMLMPISFAGSENTIDVSRLALFPLSRRDLSIGLLTSGLLSFGFGATAIALLGVVAGTAPASPYALVTVVAVAEFALLCLVTSRLIVTTLSAVASRSRRARSFALLIGPLFTALSQLVRFLPPGPDTDRVLVAIGRVLPSGPPAEAIVAARDGDAVRALMSVGTAAGMLAIVVILWSAALTRALTTAGGEGSVARRDAKLVRLPRWAPWSPLGALVVKDLRMSRRDPRQRAAMFGSFLGVFAVVPPAFAAGVGIAVYFAASVSFFVGAGATNLFGFDGRAYWMNVAAGADAAVELLAKSIARFAMAALATVPVVVLIAAITDGWHHVPAALGLSAAAFGFTLGGGLVVSVTVPVALPDDAGNLFSTGNPGQGLRAVGPSLAVLLLGGAATVPFVAGIAVVGSTAARTAIGWSAAAAGVLVWWAGLRAARRRVGGREPELLAQLDPRTA